MFRSSWTSSARSCVSSQTPLMPRKVHRRSDESMVVDGVMSRKPEKSSAISSPSSIIKQSSFSAQHSSMISANLSSSWMRSEPDRILSSQSPVELEVVLVTASFIAICICFRYQKKYDRIWHTGHQSARPTREIGLFDKYFQICLHDTKKCLRTVAGSNDCDFRTL